MTTANTPAIEFRDVSLSFEEKDVLRKVSFEVGKGETMVLLGVTGSGKSVILKLALGLLKPDSGQVLVEGQDLVPIPEDELQPLRKRMGIVFQEGALFDSLSVYENVAYRLREEGLLDEAEIERRVREVLRFVEMEQALDKMPAELSGGMRRRVSIARAIISQPAVMLYDSPTAGLDPVTSHTINVLITKLRDVGRVSSIVVTHRLADAYVLSNFIFSQEKQSLIPAQTNGQPPTLHSQSAGTATTTGSGDGAPSERTATRFLVLRDGSVYFRGTEQELAGTSDPYLRRFLA